MSGLLATFTSTGLIVPFCLQHFTLLVSIRGGGWRMPYFNEDIPAKSQIFLKPKIAKEFIYDVMWIVFSKFSPYHW